VSPRELSPDGSRPRDPEVDIAAQSWFGAEERKRPLTEPNTQSRRQELVVSVSRCEVPQSVRSTGRTSPVKGRGKTARTKVETEP
jgi:hypothetical protein